MMTATTADALASDEWRALGCVVRVVVTRSDSLPAARTVLVEELAALDLAASRFRPDSEVSRLAAAGGRPMTVSPLLLEATAAALRAAELTDGDVDPTMGAELSGLGYDRDFGAGLSTASPLPIRERRSATYRDVAIDPVAGVLQVPAGVVLDLGATAKAFAADRAAVRIAAELGVGVLVSLGGDIAVAGEAPAGGWTIEVQDAATAMSEAAQAGAVRIGISSGGLATSSVTARRWQRGGQVLHHILDPRTAAPVASVWRTVSVAAGSCLDANTASTAAVIRGAGAVPWLRGLGLPSRLVGVDGSVVTVAGWPADTEVAA